MKVSVVRPSSVCQHFQTTSPRREADSFHISHIASIGRVNEKLCFCSNRIRILVDLLTILSVSFAIFGFFFRNVY